MTVLNTTDKNFKNDVLDSSKPVLVDFGPNGAVLVKL